jgi:hypothetical protein
MRYLSLIITIFLFISCSNSTPENLPKKVDQLISEDNYTQALTLLNDANPDETEADLAKLKEKTYLNYGLYLELRGPEGSSMRDRMTSALEQFIEVLKLNPNNQKARTEINRIMGIYSTMPDKSPGQDIMDDLRKLGFKF